MNWFVNDLINNKKKVNKINQAIREGALSLNELSLEAKVSRKEIRRLKDKLMWKSFVKNSLEYFLKQGDEESLAKVVKFGFSTSRIDKIARKIKLPRKICVDPKRKLAIDGLIRGVYIKKLQSRVGPTIKKRSLQKSKNF